MNPLTSRNFSGLDPMTQRLQQGGFDPSTFWFPYGNQKVTCGDGSDFWATPEPEVSP